MTTTLPSIGSLALASGGAAALASIRELTAAELELVSGGQDAQTIDPAELERQRQALLEQRKQFLRDIGTASIAIGTAAMTIGAVPFGAFLVGFGSGLYLATSFC
ncbi:MAG: hypothetical protein LOD94_01700 [Gammaproteobacteria bacterium]